LAYISQNTILDVKRACDIYDVVSHYLPLKRAGSGHKALCPFHEEKTPSFNVNPQRQIFKCFGCGEGGGVIDFVMKIEKVEFHDAVKILAERAGIQIRYQSGGSAERMRDQTRELLRWAATFYQERLSRCEEGHPARRFLDSKRITEETSRAFQLGYAPDSWDGLIGAARRQGFPDKAIEESGMVVRTDEGRQYDRFRNRLMIPVFDASNRIVTFGGRALASDQKAKYINGPETPLFQKSRILYGLHLLKSSSEPITVVEGYFDVIGPHQNGVRGLVATLGTALTREHLSVLRRYSTNVGLLFDSDEAGRRASDRAWGMLLGHVMDATVDLRICTLPPGKDPDEISGDELRGILDVRREVVDIAVEALSRKHDPTSSAGRVAIIDELMAALRSVERTSEEATYRRDQILARIADRFDTSLAELKRRVAALRISRETADPGVRRAVRRGPEESLVRELLGVLLDAPELVREVRGELNPEVLPLRAARPLLKKMFELVDEEQPFEASDLVALFPDQPEVRALALEAASAPEESAKDPRKRFQQVLEAFNLWLERTHRKRLREEYKRTGDEALARRLQESFGLKKTLNREDR
jgi:DNA primase